MTVEAVVFDIGNVLLEWHPERYFDRTIGPERRKAMFADVDLHAMNDRIDLGEGFKDVIYATAEAYPAWRAEIRDWYDNWIELAAPLPRFPVSRISMMTIKPSVSSFLSTRASAPMCAASSSVVTPAHGTRFCAGKCAKWKVRLHPTAR